MGADVGRGCDTSYQCPIQAVEQEQVCAVEGEGIKKFPHRFFRIAGQKFLGQQKQDTVGSAPCAPAAIQRRGLFAP